MFNFEKTITMAKYVDVYIKGKMVRMSEKGAKMAQRFYGAEIFESKPISSPIPLIAPPKILVPEKEPVVIEARVKKSGELEMKETKEVTITKPKRAKKDVGTGKQKNK